MTIILRYVLKCIQERKLRTLLILSAIMISSAMFFASISLSGTLVNMQMAAFRQNYGFTDIIVRSGADSPSRWFYINKAGKYWKYAEYIIGEMSGFGTYYGNTAGTDGAKTGTTLRGIDIDELQKLTPFKFVSEKNLYPFKGMKAVISSDTAEKFGLKCGDAMLLEINGSRYRFLICGIFRLTGSMAEPGGSFRTILPLNTLNSLYNVRGRVDIVYLKLLNSAKKQRLLYLLSRDYSRYTVEEPFTEWEIKRQTDRIAAPVIIVTIILSFMCIYIIHTTFKIIVLERLPVIGTFRSIGAEKRTTNLILLLESLLYGIIGGIAGCVFGIALLYGIAAMPNSSLSAGSNIQLDITPFQLAAAFGIAVLLSLAGSIISIAKTVRMPIRDIILGAAGKTGATFGGKTVLGGVLLCLSFIVPVFTPSNIALMIDTACMTAALLAVSLLIPIITERMLRLLRICSSFLSGGLLQVTLNMLRRERNVHSGVSMLMIGISSLYMITTLNWSQIRDSTVIFDRNLYEMTMSLSFADKTTLGKIAETEGVKGVLGNYYNGRTEIEGYDEPIWHILGINTVEFPFYQKLITGQKLNTSIGQKDVAALLNKGRSIMLSNTLKQRLEVEAGDSLTLKFPTGSGGYAKRTYKITGFFDTMIKGLWSYALISDRNFKTDVRGHFYGPIYIKTGMDPVVVMNNLKAAFSKSQPDIRLKEEARKTDLQSSSQLFFMLQGFTVMTLVTGTFGILNNLIISFLQRKRQLAMLRSFGMSRRQMRRMILAEAAIQGIAGSTLGIMVGLGTTWIIVPRIIQTLNIECGIYFSSAITAFCFLIGVIANILASAGIIFKVSNLDIIQAIKQE